MSLFCIMKVQIRKGDKGGLYITLCSSLEMEMVLSFTPARESQRLTSFYREGKFVFFLLRREGYPLFAQVNGILEAAEPFLLNLQIPCLLRYDLFAIGGSVGWPAIIMLIESYYSLLPVCALFQSFCHIKFICMCCRIIVWFFVYQIAIVLFSLVGCCFVKLSIASHPCS